MAYSRRRSVEKSAEENKETIVNEIDQAELVSEVKEETQPEPSLLPKQKTGKIFLSEEDRRLLKKFNNHIVKKLNLQGSRSVKM